MPLLLPLLLLPVLLGRSVPGTPASAHVGSGVAGACTGADGGGVDVGRGGVLGAADLRDLADCGSIAEGMWRHQVALAKRLLGMSPARPFLLRKSSVDDR